MRAGTTRRRLGRSFALPTGSIGPAAHNRRRLQRRCAYYWFSSGNGKRSPIFASESRISSCVASSVSTSLRRAGGKAGAAGRVLSTPTVSSLSRDWSIRTILSSATSRFSSRSRSLRSEGSGEPGGGGVVGGSRRTAWTQREQVFLDSSLQGDRAGADVAGLEPSLDAAHLARKDAKRRRQGDAELGLLDQGEQVLGAFAELSLFLGQGGHGEQGRPGFLQDAWGLGLGRLADRHLKLVHLGQLGDRAGPGARRGAQRAAARWNRSNSSRAFARMSSAAD